VSLPLHFAKETNADLVIAALPVNKEDAKRMGIMKLNPDYSVIEFFEKPQNQELLNHLRLPLAILEQMLEGEIGMRQFLGSMGIYVFKRQVLDQLLEIAIFKEILSTLILNIMEVYLQLAKIALLIMLL
jgi:glucose-1-phosphate adenylyltransferase